MDSKNDTLPASGTPRRPPVGRSSSTEAGPRSGPGPNPPAARPPGADHGLRRVLDAMLSGVQTVIADGSVIRIDGVDRTKADVVSELQSVLALYASVDSLAAALRAERARLRQALPTARVLRQNLKGSMVVSLGRRSPELQKFGVEMRTRREPTVQRKALAAEKARRTRVLRGTKGSRQKAAIRYVGEPTLVLGPDEMPAEPGSG